MEKIFLRDKRINHCIACGACQGNEGQCSQQDDMAAILEKMIQADALVMATPVYFYSIRGQMKTLIGRTYARDTEISNKQLCFIMTAAVSRKALQERTLEGFRGFMSCLPGAQRKGRHLRNGRLEYRGHQGQCRDAPSLCIWEAGVAK